MLISQLDGFNLLATFIFRYERFFSFYTQHHGLIDFPFNKDRFATDKVTPIIDNTTQNWFIIQGREQNGWTAIQFKRFFDTCDTMDVPIKVLEIFKNN